jgi:hypothetical protein
MTKIQNKPNARYDHAFAIIRFDVSSETGSLHNRVMVVKILWDENEASREVDRLNELNSEKECEYVRQQVRVQRRGVR